MVVDWQNWDVFYEGKPRDSSENRLEPDDFDEVAGALQADVGLVSHFGK